MAGIFISKYGKMYAWKASAYMPRVSLRNSLGGLLRRYSDGTGKAFCTPIVARLIAAITPIPSISSIAGWRVRKENTPMLLAKKIRLEVTERDALALEFMQSKCRGLYNWLVMRLREGERWHFAEEKARLVECRAYDPDLNEVYGKLLAEVYFRLDKAMKAFFRRVKNGETPGFPKVRPRHAFFTLCYPAMYLKVEDNIVLLPTGGKSERKKRFPTIRARLTESVPVGYKEVAISRDARGHYYASFVYPVQEEAQAAGPVVAFDLGIKTLATGVNEQGRFYHIGGFKGYQWYNKELDKIRSKRDLCKKRSRRRIHLSQVYKRVSEQKRNKQKDSLHKASHLIAHKLVASTVVIGDLSQRQMVLKDHQEKNRARNRAVFNDWGLYTFLQMVLYKCVLAGKTLVELDERDTSKTCSRCGHRQDMPLYKRTYRCGNCGLVLDRDENSAVNILQRFLARLGPHTASAVRCIAGGPGGVAVMGAAQVAQVQESIRLNTF